ncbi:MAG: hypothetical protein PHI55_14855, partial [Burkholderiaceae bacterium]|nr:hypothetical protein [Burkholderiaceae bacterium]
MNHVNLPPRHGDTTELVRGNTGVLRGILNVLRQVCKRRSKMDLGTQRSHLVVDHIEEGDW